MLLVGQAFHRLCLFKLLTVICSSTELIAARMEAAMREAASAAAASPTPAPPPSAARACRTVIQEGRLRYRWGGPDGERGREGVHQFR